MEESFNMCLVVCLYLRGCYEMKVGTHTSDLYFKKDLLRIPKILRLSVVREHVNIGYVIHSKHLGGTQGPIRHGLRLVEGMLMSLAASTSIAHYFAKILMHK